MRELLLSSFRAAVAAADPRQVVPAHLPPPPRGRTLVVGAGKAAAAMAAAVEAAWPAEAPLSGLVLTRYAHGLPTSRVRVAEAGHPLPDEAGETGTRTILDEVGRLGEDDLLLALISGGGSALLSLPVPGLTIADLQSVTKGLLRSGAPIAEVNVVRKHLGAALGGRLAAASRAPVRALIISDVVGDDPTHVASGPCAPDPSTYGDALDILAAYRVLAPVSVRERLAAGASGGLPETPKADDPVFSRVENRVVATAHRSLLAGAAVFRQAGIAPLVLGDSITGEAAEVGKVMAALAREVRVHGLPVPPPMALVSGGECTVTVRAAQGRGGRCAELLLSLAIDLDGLPGVHAIAADTDGIDGTEDNAGAVLAPDTLVRARAMGEDARRRLRDNDSYSFFAAVGDLVVTGPTRTNVNDYRAVVVS